MMKFFRYLLRRCGMDVPYSRIICPEHATTILIDDTWRARVTVKRSLVFLDSPQPGDLRDTLPPAADSTAGGFIEGSLDSREISRHRQRNGSVVVHWQPRERVIPYALYNHQVSWVPSASYEVSAVCTECRCDKRTGVLRLEIITPGSVENAVAFKRPRWRPMNSERSVVRYALRQLEAPGERPVVTEDRRRVELKILEPVVGDRYVCMVFHRYGVVQWQERLAETSMVGRLRQLISGRAAT